MTLDLFDLLYPTFRFEKNKPIRLVELFSGIGFQRMGMDLANIPYEVVATSEIDKFAIEAYEAIHGDNNNLGNIEHIKGEDMPSDIDIMTYSFPCTDLSKAGKQEGLDGTRSGLIYEVLRLLQEMRERERLPKVLIMENVVDLIQARFIDEWNKIRFEIENLGYTNYLQTLNAREYGVAQNRDRVFMVSILGEYNYNFPKPFELDNTLKDYLEEDVDERYYLSDKMLSYVTGESNGWERQFRPLDDKSSHSHTITTREGNVAESTYVKVLEDTKRGYALAKDGDGVYINRPHQKRGVVQKGMIQTLKTGGADVGVVDGVTIRKLTPIETGRLMGMNDVQISKQREVMSNAQMYKQHGNGIVAQVIGLIIGMLYYEDEKKLKEIVKNNSLTWLRKE